MSNLAGQLPTVGAVLAGFLVGSFLVHVVSVLAPAVAARIRGRHRWNLIESGKIRPSEADVLAAVNALIANMYGEDHIVTRDDLDEIVEIVAWSLILRGWRPSTGKINHGDG